MKSPSALSLCCSARYSNTALPARSAVTKRLLGTGNGILWMTPQRRILVGSGPRKSILNTNFRQLFQLHALGYRKVTVNSCIRHTAVKGSTTSSHSFYVKQQNLPNSVPVALICSLISKSCPKWCKMGSRLCCISAIDKWAHIGSFERSPFVFTEA